MHRFAAGSSHRNGYAACSGCSLCLLVCPVWRATRDPRLTPEGRAKGLQSGAPITELADAARACTLCGACEPVCPERIDLIGMTLNLRGLLAEVAPSPAPRVQRTRERIDASAGNSNRDVATQRRAAVRLMCGAALKSRADALARALGLIGATVCEDDGADIVLALTSGLKVSPERLAEFLAPLRRARTIVVDDGAWLRHLRGWLPGVRMLSLGEALSSKGVVRRGLRPSDLYVIEARAYHADYERLVGHYDRLRRERDCTLNLDLQRIAVPVRMGGQSTAMPQALRANDAQARWILQGRGVERVVVECMEDAAPFEAIGGLAVVHLAELAQD